MNADLLRALSEEITGVMRGRLDQLAAEVAALRAGLASIPAGPPGVGIKSIAQAPDLSAADFEFDNGQVIEVQLPKGPPGAPGAPGGPGPRGEAPPPEEVAAVLKASPDFLEAVTPAVLQAAAWSPGIYRKGATVSHFIGRTYAAELDTTAEPGTSSDWRRIGSHGLRHVGGLKDAALLEPGDIYAKDLSTFLFDGARHWLLMPRPYSAADAEKDNRATAKAIKELRADLAALTRATDETQAVAQLAAEAVAKLQEVSA